jgi:hypothetical protein
MAGEPILKGWYWNNGYVKVCIGNKKPTRIHIGVCESTPLLTYVQGEYGMTDISAECHLLLDVVVKYQDKRYDLNVGIDANTHILSAIFTAFSEKFGISDQEFAKGYIKSINAIKVTI